MRNKFPTKNVSFSIELLKMHFISFGPYYQVGPLRGFSFSCIFWISIYWEYSGFPFRL